MAMMTTRQAIFSVSLAVLLFVFVIELVRRRHLREEYSWLWVVASAGMVLLITWPAALRTVIHISGASKATTTLFMLTVAFLAVVCVHLCTKLTQATEQTKRIAQQVAIIQRREPDRVSTVRSEQPRTADQMRGRGTES